MSNQANLESKDMKDEEWLKAKFFKLEKKKKLKRKLEKILNLCSTVQNIPPENGNNHKTTDFLDSMKTIYENVQEMKILNPYKDINQEVFSSLEKENPEQVRKRSPRRESAMAKKVKFNTPIVQSNQQKSEAGSKSGARNSDTVFKQIINSYYSKKPKFSKVLQQLNSETSTIKTHEQANWHVDSAGNSHYHNESYTHDFHGGGIDITHSKAASQIMAEINNRLKYQSRYYNNSLKKTKEDFKRNHDVIKVNLRNDIRTKLDKYIQQNEEKIKEMIKLEKEQVIKEVAKDDTFRQIFEGKIRDIVKAEFKGIMKSELENELMDRLEGKEINRIATFKEKVLVNMATKNKKMEVKIIELDAKQSTLELSMEKNKKTMMNENVKLNSKITDQNNSQNKLIRRVEEFKKKIENSKDMMEKHYVKIIEENNDKTLKITNEFMEDAKKKNNTLNETVKVLASSHEELGKDVKVLESSHKELGKNVKLLQCEVKNYEELKNGIERIIRENSKPRNFEFIEEEQAISSDENDFDIEVKEDSQVLDIHDKGTFSKSLSTLVEYVSDEEVLMTQFMKGYVYKNRFGVFTDENSQGKIIFSIF